MWTLILFFLQFHSFSWSTQVTANSHTDRQTDTRASPQIAWGKKGLPSVGKIDDRKQTGQGQKGSAVALPVRASNQAQGERKKGRSSMSRHCSRLRAKTQFENAKAWGETCVCVCGEACLNNTYWKEKRIRKAWYFRLALRTSTSLTITFSKDCVEFNFYPFTSVQSFFFDTAIIPYTNTSFSCNCQFKTSLFERLSWQYLKRILN